MSNFAFLSRDFGSIVEAAMLAETHIHGDPRAACFHARFCLEHITHWLYRHDRSLAMPYDNSLGAMLHEPCFQNLLPQAIFQKARVILKQGNTAVHNVRPVQQYTALQTVKELHHVCHWLSRTYAHVDAGPWSNQLVPQPPAAADVVPRRELETLQQQLIQQNAAALTQQQERDQLDQELQALRLQLEQMRAESEQQHDPRDLSEADTRHLIIDVDLRRAGWALDQERDREYEVHGMPTDSGIGYADYVLWGDDGKPLAVVEAKRSTTDPHAGQQQAKLYADCLQQMHGQRPVIFFSNGYETWIWDDLQYPPRQVAGFYGKDDLNRLLLRRSQQTAIESTQVRDQIAGRYYQKRAIASIGAQFQQSRRKALLVMATGTGKTRTAIALVDVLQRAGWVKRALFLADRVSLVSQAVNAFKAHLPDCSPVNLVTEKGKDGRVYVCTYPTMMGLIDSADDGTARFNVGHFDLVIIDEAHRSVYQKYGAIFRYFDSLLVGLTATPREDVDKNTYDLFELEAGVPTDAYELEQAVAEGFLVPPRVQQVNLRFPREGIEYNRLSDAERAEWDLLEWGADDNGAPDRVQAGAVNSWMFNDDTADKMLQHLMEHGHRVDAGDKLGKTIIFARNHDHAVHICNRFNVHYPQYAGQFARVIDNREKYAQSLIEQFSVAASLPQIAISVDMMDTGIDVPDVANLVFAKPVYSKIKFWQMIGRGTRLCPDLFGPEQDKADFRIFDFCGNFEYFAENPDGISGSDSAPLGTRLFRARLDLLGHVRRAPELDPDRVLDQALTTTLHGEVAAMNRDNFLVRMKLQAVERFQQRDQWDDLDDDARETISQQLAGLPSEIETDNVQARMFDLTALRLQLALVEGDMGAFERHRQRVVEMATLLETKTTIPAVIAQLAYLASVQETEFWEGQTLQLLEDLRLRVRGLVQFLDKNTRTLVYAGFQDDVLSVGEFDAVPVPKMTGLQYEKKVASYLRDHVDDAAIHKLRTNEPLTEDDLTQLEATLVAIGEDSGQQLLQELLTRREAPTLPYFVRSIVGMDRGAAVAAFAEYLSDRSLTAQQMRFVELLIDQLTSRGVVEAGSLYEAPFTSLHAGGPDELFAGKDRVIDGLFAVLQRLNAGGLAG